MARSKSIQIDKGVSLSQRGDSSFWQITITRNGRRTRESLNTRDRDAAIAIARQRADVALSQANNVVIPRDISYDDMFRVYEAHASLRNTANTRELNFGILNEICAFIRRNFAGDRPLVFSDFSQEAIEAYMSARTKGGCKPETVNRERSALLSFFSRVLKRKLIRFNPVAAVDPVPAVKRRKPVTMSPEAIAALLKEAAKPIDNIGPGNKGDGTSRPRLTPLFDLIVFFLNTAARLGEALYLEWSDVDFNAGLITFANKAEHQIKDMEDRTIKMNLGVQKILAERKATAGDCRWVFPSQTGEVLDRKNVLRELKNAGRRAKLGKVNFLILRHTALTAAARSGAPGFIIKEFAGHASIRTTERYYLGKMGAENWTPPTMGA